MKLLKSWRIVKIERIEVIEDIEVFEKLWKIVKSERIEVIKVIEVKGDWDIEKDSEDWENREVIWVISH